MRKTLLFGCVLILLIAGTAAFGDEAPGGSGPETLEISLEITEGQYGFSRGLRRVMPTGGEKVPAEW